LLELTMADGEMSTVWVDTASKGSIVMPPAQWKEWKADHPHAAKADEINLGALTLTDVAVKEMPAAEAEDLLSETPAATVVWKFGISALSRLDLVVDGKNGWAYLHPKPTTGLSKNKANAAVEGGDWKVAENVQVYADNLFVYSGFYKLYKSDFAGALADLNRALELNPRNASAYSYRGAVREVRGDFSDAVADYEKVIELRPGNSEWEQLYRHALLIRQGRPSKEDAIPTAEGGKPSGPVVALDPMVVYGTRPKGAASSKERWVKTLGLFLDGKLDKKELLAAAKKGDGRMAASEQKALAAYYIGLASLSQGDRAAAREWFQKCEAAGIKDDDEYYFAAAELARIDAPR